MKGENKQPTNHDKTNRFYIVVGRSVVVVFGFEKHVCVLFKYRYLDHRSIICTVWCIKHGLLTTFPKKKNCVMN